MSRSQSFPCLCIKRRSPLSLLSCFSDGLPFILASSSVLPVHRAVLCCNLFCLLVTFFFIWPYFCSFSIDFFMYTFVLYIPSNLFRIFTVFLALILSDTKESVLLQKGMHILDLYRNLRPMGDHVHLILTIVLVFLQSCGF
jgi:hypothetical protein